MCQAKERVEWQTEKQVASCQGNCFPCEQEPRLPVSPDTAAKAWRPTLDACLPRDDRVPKVQDREEGLKASQTPSFQQLVVNC